MPSEAQLLEGGKGRQSRSSRSSVSSRRGGVINTGRRESLEGCGDILFPYFWVGEIRGIATPGGAGSCACQTICPTECQGTHAGLASAWGWRDQASPTPGLRHSAAHSSLPFQWGQFATAQSPGATDLRPLVGGLRSPMRHGCQGRHP